MVAVCEDTSACSPGLALWSVTLSICYSSQCRVTPVTCLLNEWTLWDGCWGLVMQWCGEETELQAEGS